MDVTISVNPEQITAIETAFDLGDRTPAQKKEAYVEFCELAVKQCTNWISGKARYRSLTEMQIEMAQAFYETLLPEEVPSADRLFNKFNLPPGQAAYIARVLTEKAVPRWRGVAIKELREVIDRLTKEKKNVSEVDAKDTSVQEDISRRAFRELTTISNELKRKDPGAFVMVESVGGLGEFKRAQMLIVTLRRIQEYMKEKELGE